MAHNRNQAFGIVAITLTGCVGMAAVELLLKPGYVAKSLIKLLFFLVIPLAYLCLQKRWPGDLLRPGGRLGVAVLLGVAVYGLILGGYFLLAPLFDFSLVTGALSQNAGVTRENFVWVSLYISLVNSFLEEFFFRGFAFLSLGQVTTRRSSHLFGAASFALYHISIMADWFSPLLTALLIAALFLSGLVLNRLDEQGETLFPSWMVHMFANFSINTIGFMLFGIL